MAFREAYGDTLAVSGSATKSGRIQFFEDTDNGTNSLVLQAPASMSDLVLTLPSSDGSDGHVLKTDGSGVLSFGAASAGSIAADDIGDGDAAVNIVTTSGNITVDSNAGTVNLDGHTGVAIASSNSGDITLDSVADIVIDAAGGNVEFKDAGVLNLTLDMDGEGTGPVIKLGVDADDLIFQQYDGYEVMRLNDNASVAMQKLESTNASSIDFNFPIAAMSGAFEIAMADNVATALSIKEGSTSYMTFVTTNSGEKITLGAKLDCGDANIENVGDIALDSISADAAAAVAFNFPEAVMSGAFEIAIADNVAASLVIAEGANDYMTFKTSNNAESVTIDKAFKAAASQYQNVTLITPGATAVDYSADGAVSFVAATPTANATVFLPSVSGSGVAGRTIVFKNLSDTKSLELQAGDATARIYAGGTAIASGSGYIVGTDGASVTAVSGPSAGGWQDWYIF